MNAVEACYVLTEELITVLKKVTSDSRDKTIESMQELLAKREQLLPLIKPPFSEQEALVGKKLIVQQQELDRLLLNIKQDIQKDMNGLTKKKSSMKRYINPYENMQTDGFFLDKRN
ncbi:flagellar protein FliT [Bacillus sp. FJAT-49736]|uniref:flagellar protein FliT n=1 Tax=Bacillus sp. FJAT-49736 TaxID=2833582 RepID=UPI001BC9CCCF|nr:flagellar protein FliT [Bacillus sp. FJAT-49736]MBS4174145.1 flagellar protein FliT [Bacillus sp. FJAT-49736]